MKPFYAILMGGPADGRALPLEAGSGDVIRIPHISYELEPQITATYDPAEIADGYQVLIYRRVKVYGLPVSRVSIFVHDKFLSQRERDVRAERPGPPDHGLGHHPQDGLPSSDR